MRIALLGSILFITAACSQIDPFSDEEKAEIDCLASITVVSIMEAVRTGTENGLTAEDLSAIPDNKIAEAVSRLEVKYPGRMDTAFLEYDINHRLDKIQDALANRTPTPESLTLMNETLELGKSCEFGS